MTATSERAADFHARSYQADGATVLALAGEVDLAVQEWFRTCLRGCRGTVVVDLDEVTFFDSSAISALISQRRRLDGALTVRNANPNIRHIFRIVGIEDLLG
jgi:anti-anti-sigma factor